MHLRAGMKLTLETAVDGGHQAYREWVDLTSELVDQGIKAAVGGDDARGHRLAWNLCAGFVGAVSAVGVLREDIDLPARVDDVLTSYLESSKPEAAAYREEFGTSALMTLPMMTASTDDASAPAFSVRCDSVCSQVGDP